MSGIILSFWKPFLSERPYLLSHEGEKRAMLEYISKKRAETLTRFRPANPKVFV